MKRAKASSNDKASTVGVVGRAKKRVARAVEKVKRKIVGGPEEDFAQEMRDEMFDPYDFADYD